MFNATILILNSLLSTTPYQNSALGLKMDLPEGAVVMGTRDNPPFCIISSGDEDNVWHLRLERSENPESKTVKEIVLQSITVGSNEKPKTTIESGAMKVGALEGWWKAEESTTEIGNMVLGKLGIPAHGNQFILASVLATDVSWRRNSVMLKRTLQSIVPLDPIALIQDNLKGLEAATKQLTSLDEDYLRTLVGFKEWRRIQKSSTGSGPASDIGYALIQIETGNIEEVELHNGKEKMVPNGIIVQVISRLVPNPDTGIIIDSYARYWMSWDGKEERWSNRVTRSMGKAKATECETGLRNRREIGSPKSRLMVIQQDLTSDIIETPFKTLSQDPWLPRALVWILGPILSSVNHDACFIWKTYENSGGVQRVVIRTDSIEKYPDGTRVITTRFGEENVSVWTTIDPNGRMILQEQKEDAFVTGTTEDVLRAIWSPRNLW
tara:strand:- start:1291 stop:2604 length:1314 start_codon:yes stop_codon:yes gene_type:complete